MRSDWILWNFKVTFVLSVLDLMGISFPWNSWIFILVLEIHFMWILIWIWRSNRKALIAFDCRSGFDSELQFSGFWKFWCFEFHTQILFYRPNRDMGIGPRTSSIKGSHGLIAWNLLTDICWGFGIWILITIRFMKINFLFWE